MANEPISPILPKNPDPQSKGISGDDITSSQEQPSLPDKPPKSLLDWLVRVHLRLTALEHERNKDTS